MNEMEVIIIFIFSLLAGAFGMWYFTRFEIKNIINDWVSLTNDNEKLIGELTSEIETISAEMMKLITQIEMHVEFLGDIYINHEDLEDVLDDVEMGFIEMSLGQKAPTTPKKQLLVLDMDNLLEKISKSGVESLTKDEIEYLNKKGKEL